MMTFAPRRMKGQGAFPALAHAGPEPFRALLLSRTPNPLRQMFPFELKAHTVVFWISDVREAINQAQYKEDRGIQPKCNPGFAFFNLDQRCPAYGSALRGDGDRNPPSPPCIPKIVTQFVQRMPDRDRQCH